MSDLYAHPAMPVADLTVQYDGETAHLEFSADPVRTYVVASTGLVQWTQLGTATPGQGGNYDFYDAEAGNAASRFYRVLDPVAIPSWPP